jgi:O-methyltransferase
MAFYRTMVRPRLKQVAISLGLKRSRTDKARIPPDFDDQTRRLFLAVAEYTMTGPERVAALVNAVRYVVANGVEGDFVECGVWRGGSAMAAALVLKELGDERRHLYLYDTFEGMSAPTDADVAIDGKPAAPKFADRKLGEDSSDWCRSPLDDVRRNLDSTGYPAANLHFIKGKVEATLPDEMPRGAIAILRLDTDWYESTRHELTHLYPRLVRGGVLIIDDYGHWLGARKAVDEFLAETRQPLLLNRVDDTARIAVKP